MTIKKCTKKCAARAKLLLGSVVKLDRTSVYTYNGDFGAIHISDTYSYYFG